MSATSWGTQPSSLEEIGNAADAKLDCLGIVAYNEDPGEHPQFNMGNNGVANVQIANKRGKSFAGGRYMRVYCAPEARQNPETQTLSNLYLERLRRLAKSRGRTPVQPPESARAASIALAARADSFVARRWRLTPDVLRPGASPLACAPRDEDFSSLPPNKV